MSTDLYLLAAERSADKLGASLVKTLHTINPSLSIAALAGPLLREQDISFSPKKMEDLQVMGFTDVAFALPRLARLFFQIRKEILDLNPKAVVTIDYPDFNLRLAASLKRAGFQGKLIHYVCPTVWAWRKRRVHAISRTFDLLLTLFPFEKECFTQTSLKTIYVGHPLTVPTQTFRFNSSFYKKYHLDHTKKILAIFPGSRKNAIERNFPIQWQAANLLSQIHPDVQIAVSLADATHKKSLLQHDPNIILIEPNDTYALMHSSHLNFATSGTINLELALFSRPTVITYAIRPFDLFLARNILCIDLPHYCIVNILCGQRVFPELYGPNLSLPSLLEEAHALWQPGLKRDACIQGCQKTQHLLNISDPANTAARAILEQCMSKTCSQ